MATLSTKLCASKDSTGDAFAVKQSAVDNKGRANFRSRMIEKLSKKGQPIPELFRSVEMGRPVG